VGDPLFGALYRLAAVEDAAYAVLPVEAREREEDDGSRVLELAGGPRPPRSGRVLLVRDRGGIAPALPVPSPATVSPPSRPWPAGSCADPPDPSKHLEHDPPASSFSEQVFPLSSPGGRHRRCRLPGAGPGRRPPPPAADELEGLLELCRGVEVEITGNVARVSLVVDPAPFAGGGDLWAKGFALPLPLLAGDEGRPRCPFPGLGGVRVVTVHPGGDVMAEALLSRGTLNDYTWRRALNVAAQARRDATERPGRMRDLVQWGEDHTEFEYNPRYISSR
jgi:hypothetical protein